MRSNVAEPQEAGFAAAAPFSPKRPYRHKLRTLSHASLDATHGAILRDVSEFGIALQTVTPLDAGQELSLRFELPAPRVKVEAIGRVAWTDSWGQAGLQFVDLSPRSRRLLKEWILTQILSAAFLFSPCESLEAEGNRAGSPNELLFSSSARPAIQIVTQEIRLPDSPPDQRRLKLSWWPLPMSLVTLAKFVDGLILFCSVLLFALVAMAMTDVLPTWPVALALVSGVAAIFIALYWFLFGYWFCVTPGARLALLAYLEYESRIRAKEELPRFR